MNLLKDGGKEKRKGEANGSMDSKTLSSFTLGSLISRPLASPCLPLREELEIWLEW